MPITPVRSSCTYHPGVVSVLKWYSDCLLALVQSLLGNIGLQGEVARDERALAAGALEYKDSTV